MKDCPFCSKDPSRPAVEMKPLRKLLLMIWRMELAQAGLLDDGYDPIRDPLAELSDTGIPLSGLQVKLADLSIHLRLVSEFVDQLLNPNEQSADPLYLIRHSQLLNSPLNPKKPGRG